MTNASKPLTQDTHVKASQAVQQGSRPMPLQVAPEEAERQRTATSTYNYLFSTELTAPD